MKSLLALRHVGFEHLGTFAPVFAAHGYDIAYRDAGVDELSAIDPLAADMLVMLGGPIGAYEEELYPFVRDELAILERRLKADRPTLGICLGSQMMARALGARVYAGSGKEVGWSPLQLTQAGDASPLAQIGPKHTLVLHWHGDTFDLPDGATLLASTEKYPHQAFARGANVLGLQFHAEIDPHEIERWLIGHACEIAGLKDTGVAALRADTARFGPILARQGAKFLEAWLAQLRA
jgi:GMP synthase (glutamine-hydrolysing)